MDAEKREILQRRISRVRKAAKKSGIELFLVSGEENKRYLSMFSSTSFDLVIGQERSWLLTDFRYLEAASETEPLFEVVEVTGEYGLKDFLKEKRPASLGIERAVLTVREFDSIRKILPECEFIAADGIAEKIRAVKDTQELEKIRHAAGIADRAFSWILGEIRPGVSEKQIAWLLERKMREEGASALSFDTICASGVRSSMPHAHPTEALIQNGDFVTMDFGCVFEGYCSDMTRTVAVGFVSEEQREIYRIVLEAQKHACEKIRAGMTGREADVAARDIISRAGYGKYFGHSLGHGVGLEIHEAPAASPRSSEILEKNMTVTIEPGIYLPKKFGVRIEDLSVVGDTGIINLVNSEKELIIL